MYLHVQERIVHGTVIKARSNAVLFAGRDKQLCNVTLAAHPRRILDRVIVPVEQKTQSESGTTFECFPPQLNGNKFTIIRQCHTVHTLSFVSGRALAMSMCASLCVCMYVQCVCVCVCVCV